ncbi:MAG: segregation/condensation protein A [bacterium]|nr:segregation/condensation protein A [bacterium]
MYQVNLNVFKGPFDLLLYLIKKQEVDIYDISISEITDEYLTHLNKIETLDLNELSRFLVIAAILIQIKSKALLPEKEKNELEIEEEETESELSRKLANYKKYQEITKILEQYKEDNEEIYTKLHQEEEKELDLESLKLKDLIVAFSEIIKEFSQKEDVLEVRGEEISLLDKIEEINEIVSKRENVRFSEIFARCRSKMELIVAFLALLELIRRKKVRAFQKEHFSEIWLSSA